MKHLVAAFFATSCLVGMASGWAPSSAKAAEISVPAVADGLSGVVTGPSGPEAGVWVIAETHDLATRYTKIVVTDDLGRYVVPELPKAKYKVWVRGYGLVDSKPVDATPGSELNLTAVKAPDAKAAAQYYPADYWLALVHPPAAGEFPGTGAAGNGIAPAEKSQQQLLKTLKNCAGCHQLGDLATRELADNTFDGWDKRVQQYRAKGDPSMGDQGRGTTLTMQYMIAQMGHDASLKMLADWTQRIAKGEVPPQAPPRPHGVERNIVVTEWDWGNGSFLHDEIATDKRDPTVNGKGPIYGVESNVGKIAILDPYRNKMDEITIPGATKTFVHSLTMDSKGRVWFADEGPHFQPDIDQGKRPDFCGDEKGDAFAKYFPNAGGLALVRMFDPVTKKITTISTCFRANHPYFTNDDHNTLFLAGDSVMGWIDTKVWDETHDPKQAQGWCPMVLDTKERGVTKAAFGEAEPTITPDRAQWNAQRGPLDPNKDTRITDSTYGLGVNPVDNSVWLGIIAYPGGIVRMERGAHPPETCKAEYYEPPKLPDGTYAAFSPRDAGFDSKGIAWVPFDSGQFGRFDRSKCHTTRGPAATGQHCPEGWTIYDNPPVPQIAPHVSSDVYYQSFVDLFDTSGLGKDTPMTSGSNSDSLIAVLPDSGKFVNFRVPYPLGFYSRWLDGRIDDPKAGWKGRGVWATFSDVPVWHQENPDNGELVKFQLRPDPLAH